MAELRLGAQLMINFFKRLSLLWKRFSPLEERLLLDFRKVLPTEAQAIFDAQISAVNGVTRYLGWNELIFYPKTPGDWGNVPKFTGTGSLQLAEGVFKVAGKKYRARLECYNGYLAFLKVWPGSKTIAFEPWDGQAQVALLNNPLVEHKKEAPALSPDWIAVLKRQKAMPATNWTLHDGSSAFPVALEEGEFLVLGEREGDEFILQRVDPPGKDLYFQNGHDAKPKLAKALEKLIWEVPN
jgi:hypothetical protein